MLNLWNVFRVNNSRCNDPAFFVVQVNFSNFANLVGKTWIQNQALDCGTNPPAVAAIIEMIKDYTLGYKLPGAGGGGDGSL